MSTLGHETKMCHSCGKHTLHEFDGTIWWCLPCQKRTDCNATWMYCQNCVGNTPHTKISMRWVCPFCLEEFNSEF